MHEHRHTIVLDCGTIVVDHRIRLRNREAVQLQSPGSRSAPWVGGVREQRKPCKGSTVIRATLTGLFRRLRTGTQGGAPRLRLSADRQAASLTLGFGVRRLQRQDGTAS